jgi:non-ribosomal peptide synthetase component F/acyl carrier protein
MTLEECAADALGQRGNVTAAQFARYSFIQLGGDSLRALRLVVMAHERLAVHIPVGQLLDDTPLAQVLREAVPAVRQAPATEATGVAAKAPGPTGHDGDARDDSTANATANADVKGAAKAAAKRAAAAASASTAPNLAFVAFSACPLDHDTLQRTIDAVVARHEGLRSVLREDGGTIRRVAADRRPRLGGLERETRQDAFEEYVRRIAAERGRVPFDIATEPGLNFLHVFGRRNRSALIMIAHHEILDRWAIGLVLREIFSLYESLENLKSREKQSPSPVRMTEVVPLQRLADHQDKLRAAGEWDRQAAFWKSELAGVPTTLDLPADRPRPGVRDPAAARLSLDLGEPASTAIAEFARRAGVTPFAFLLGAYGLTLSRWTGARSLVIGVPLTGRGTSDLERLVAAVGNLVPVRVDVVEEASTGDYLRQVQRTLARALDNGSLPFPKLLDDLAIERGTACHPLVQACFSMHDQLVPQYLEARRGLVRIEEVHCGNSRFDLSLLIRQSEPSFAGALAYATAVWNPAEAQAFIEDFTEATRQLAQSADMALEDVRCVAPRRLRFLEEINATGRDLPATCLEELFSAVVRRHRGAVAIRAGAHELTYAQLATAVVAQARLLREAGVRPGDRVLVGLERGLAEVVAVLGTVWAGAAYIGVDLSHPADDLDDIDDIVARLAPAAVVAAPDAVAAKRFDAAGIPIVACWDPAWRRSPGSPVAHPFPVSFEPVPATPPAAPDPERTVYMTLTSGDQDRDQSRDQGQAWGRDQVQEWERSTGAPRAVSVPHRAVIRLAHNASYLRLGPGERMLRLSPLTFDAATLEIWGALLTGATLEVYPPVPPSPAELAAFLAERGVTVAWLTGGLFRLVAQSAPEKLAGLRQLLTGRDVVPHDLAARVLAANPDLILTNCYGLPENTTLTTAYSIASPQEIDGPLPIGTPVPGTRLYILDERGRQLPPGAIGELYAAGDGLAHGYVGAERETNQSFGHFSPDIPERLYRTGDLVRIDTAGNLRFLGRKEDQLTSRGHRVEPAEISGALATHPRLADAVVIVVGAGGGGDVGGRCGAGGVGKRLLAAYVPAPDATPPPSPAALRDFLSQLLPSGMVPDLWAMVDHVPVTDNGNVDRAALLGRAAPVAAGEPPSGRPNTASRSVRDNMRAWVTALFAETTGRPDPREDEDFFTAGGDSLRAVRLISLLGKEFDVILRLCDFMSSPTPAGLSRLLEEAVEEATQQAQMNQ